MDDTELEVLQDIRTNTSNTASRLNTVNNTLTTISTALVELRGQVIDVRNKVDDVKTVRVYIDGHPAGATTADAMERTSKKFAELYNAGYRVLANLGVEDNWATLIMGKYKAPNQAK